jgi:hypothetical protein
LTDSLDFSSASYGHDAVDQSPSSDNWSGGDNNNAVELVGVSSHQATNFC